MASLARIEPEGFQRSFLAHYPPVCRFFGRRGFGTDDCRDLAQETFLHALRGWERFRGESSRTTWLYTIAGNCLRKEVRRRKAAKREGHTITLPGLQAEAGPRGQCELTAPACGALESLGWDETLAFLRRAVAGLPEQMRRCLRLRVEQERSYREIARLLSVTDDTVKSHLLQARRRLRGELERAASARPAASAASCSTRTTSRTRSIRPACRTTAS
jgi:RNA polymerase sigma factor (sigma-70 family)